jgi:hypothetical protein
LKSTPLSALILTCRSNVKVSGLETKLKKVSEEKSHLTHEKTHAEKNIGQLNQKIALLEKDVSDKLFYSFNTYQLDRFKNAKGSVSYHIQMKIAALTRNYERIRGDLVDKNIDLKRELSKLEEDLTSITETTQLEEEQFAKALESEYSAKVGSIEREQSQILKDKETAFAEVRKMSKQIKVTHRPNSSPKITRKSRKNKIPSSAKRKNSYNLSNKLKSTQRT